MFGGSFVVAESLQETTSNFWDNPKSYRSRIIAL